MKEREREYKWMPLSLSSWFLQVDPLFTLRVKPCGALWRASIVDQAGGLLFLSQNATELELAKKEAVEAGIIVSQRLTRTYRQVSKILRAVTLKEASGQQ